MANPSRFQSTPLRLPHSLPSIQLAAVYEVSPSALPNYKTRYCKPLADSTSTSVVDWCGWLVTSYWIQKVVSASSAGIPEERNHAPPSVGSVAIRLVSRASLVTGQRGATVQSQQVVDGLRFQALSGRVCLKAHQQRFQPGASRRPSPVPSTKAKAPSQLCSCQARRRVEGDTKVKSQIQPYGGQLQCGATPTPRRPSADNPASLNYRIHGHPKLLYTSPKAGRWPAQLLPLPLCRPETDTARDLSVPARLHRGRRGSSQVLEIELRSRGRGGSSRILKRNQTTDSTSNEFLPHLLLSISDAKYKKSPRKR